MLALLFVVLDVDLARAQGLPLELAWEAPAECPGADDVRSELERIVVVEADRAPDLLRASGAIVHTPRGFRLVLETERAGERGRRTLVASRCADLLDAATLVLALAYGAGVELRTDAPPAEPPPEEVVAPVPVEPAGPPVAPAPPVAPPPEPEPLPIAPATSDDTLRGTVLVEIGASGGLLSQPTFLGVLGGELGNAFARGRLRVGIAPGATVPIEGGASAELHDGFAGLEGCAGAPVSWLRGEACAGVVVHGIYARASGIAESREAIAPLVTLRASLDVAARVDTIELRLVAGLEWATSRPRFEVLGLGVVHVVGELSLTGGLVVAWSP